MFSQIFNITILCVCVCVCSIFSSSQKKSLIAHWWMTQNLLIASFFFFFLYFILFSDKVLQHLKGHDHYVQGVSWDPLNIVREGRERKRDFLTWHVLCCVRVVDKNRSSFQNVFPRVSSLSFSLVSKLTILKKNEIQMGWKQFNKSRCQKRNGNFSLLTFSSSFSRLKKKKHWNFDFWLSLSSRSLPSANWKLFRKSFDVFYY